MMSTHEYASNSILSTLELHRNNTTGHDGKGAPKDQREEDYDAVYERSN
jgi:hypothetical protein